MMSKVAIVASLVVLLQAAVEAQDVFVNEVHFDKTTGANGFVEIVGSPATDATDQTTMKAFLALKDFEGALQTTTANEELSLVASDAGFSGKLVGIQKFPSAMEYRGAVGLSATTAGAKRWYCWGSGMAVDHDLKDGHKCDEVIDTSATDESFDLSLINKDAAKGWAKTDFNWKALRGTDKTENKPNAGKEGTTDVAQVWTGMSASRSISAFSVLAVLCAFLWN